MCFQEVAWNPLSPPTKHFRETSNQAGLSPGGIVPWEAPGQWMDCGRAKRTRVTHTLHSCSKTEKSSRMCLDGGGGTF